MPRRVSVEWNRCKGISSLPNNFTYLGRRLQLAKRSNKPAIGPKTGPPDLTTTPLPKKALTSLIPRSVVANGLLWTEPSR